jgi:hypothetical protein
MSFSLVGAALSLAKSASGRRSRKRMDKVVFIILAIGRPTRKGFENFEISE